MKLIMALSSPEENSLTRKRLRSSIGWLTLRSTNRKPAPATTKMTNIATTAGLPQPHSAPCDSASNRGKKATNERMAPKGSNF